MRPKFLEISFEAWGSSSVACQAELGAGSVGRCVTGLRLITESCGSRGALWKFIVLGMPMLPLEACRDQHGSPKVAVPGTYDT